MTKQGKESCSKLSYNTGFLISKEGLNYVNNFLKTFVHILNFEFYRLYYIVKSFLVNYSINAWLYFTNNLRRRIS